MSGRIMKALIMLVSILGLTACDFLPEANEVESLDLVVEEIAIDQLEGVEYFRPGALAHILEGELNRNGDAVGYHYEGLSTAKGQVVEGTRSNPNSYGVYEAEVQVEGVPKRGNKGISSFFPLHWTTQEVVDAINEAYENRQHITGNTFEGLTEEGLTIQMYLDQEEKIISAFPIK